MTMDARTGAIFSFSTRNDLFGQIWSKKIKIVKFGTQAYSNKQLNGGVRFFCFRLKAPFLDKFGLKNQTFHFKLKFGNQSNLKMLNSTVVFNFSVLLQQALQSRDQKPYFQKSEFKKKSRSQLSRQFPEKLFQAGKIIFQSPKLIGQKLSYGHLSKNKRLKFLFLRANL